MADNENEDGPDNLLLGDEEIAVRRHQVLMLGVVLLGIISICLSVSMPSDLEFDNTAIPSSENHHDPIANVVNDDPSSPLFILMKNSTNSTSKSFFRNPEDSVENSLLRSIAIHKTIQGLQKDTTDQDPPMTPTIDEDSLLSSEEEKVDQIVQSFMATEEFEDFVIDVEITDAIKRLRRKRGYKKRDSTIFDDLFKQIERHFIGDNAEEVRLVRRVGQELERRAREVIVQRRKSRGLLNDEDEDDGEDGLLASEIYNDWEMISGASSGGEEEEDGNLKTTDDHKEL